MNDYGVSVILNLLKDIGMWDVRLELFILLFREKKIRLKRDIYWKKTET